VRGQREGRLGQEAIVEQDLLALPACPARSADFRRPFFASDAQRASFSGCDTLLSGAFATASAAQGS